MTTKANEDLREALAGARRSAANWIKIATDLQSQLVVSEEDKIKLSTEIATLTEENERLRNDLRDWAECCQMDTVMQGPARMGWNRSALDRCLAKYDAALQPEEGE